MNNEDVLKLDFLQTIGSMLDRIDALEKEVIELNKTQVGDEGFIVDISQRLAELERNK